MNKIERYIGKTVVAYTLLVIVVLMLILGLTLFMGELSRVSPTYTFEKITHHTLLTLPMLAYEYFPVALLIGTLIGLGGMANHSELTVLRVSGWSVARIFVATIKPALWLWVAFSIMGEFIAPKLEVEATKIRAEALNQQVSMGSGTDFWLKDNARIIHVGRVISDHEFRQLTIYDMNDSQLRKHQTVKQAVYKDGVWTLKGVSEKRIEFTSSAYNIPGLVDHPLLGLKFEKMAEMVGHLPIEPDLIQSLQVETRYMGIVELNEYINFLNENQLDAESHKLAFWRKVAAPFMIIGIIALVFPVIFGSQRQVSIGQRIFMGILIGMSFHLLNQVIGNLAVVYHYSPLLGAVLPSFVLMSVAFILMRRLR